MKRDNKIFIEEGFFESQLLWILIIFLEYCRKKNIKEIVFEKKYELIFKNKIIKKELEGFKVIFLVWVDRSLCLVLFSKCGHTLY